MNARRKTLPGVSGAIGLPTGEDGGEVDAGGDELGLELPDFSPAPMGAGGAAAMEGFGADFGFDSSEGDLGLELEESEISSRRIKEGPERRLARMVEINEERAAKILRQWASAEAA